MNFDIEPEDYSIDKNKKIISIESYNSSLFYGEVDSHDIYEIVNKYIFNKENDVNNFSFLDIGSGCGKLIIYLNKKIDFFYTGIEIIQHRHAKSLSFLKEDDFNIEFINDNFKNFYLGNYDIIYCCNLIFSEDDNNLLYFKLNKEFKGYALLFTYNNKIIHRLIDIHNVNTSWNNNVLMYLFYF